MPSTALHFLVTIFSSYSTLASRPVEIKPDSAVITKRQIEKVDFTTSKTEEHEAKKATSLQEKTEEYEATYPFALAKAMPFTMVPEPRLRFMYDAVQRVNQNGIAGDIVEAGVWKGGTSMVMALAQLQTSRPGLERHSWLYDTYEGLPAPSSDKDDPRAKEIYKKIQDGDREDESHHIEQGKWNYGPEDLVRKNMYSTGFPRDKIHFVRGKVEDTTAAPQNLPEKIAILRLDTDWYDSTKAELQRLLPRLQPGGLLFIDDYCAWQGSHEAVDEALDMHAIPLVREGELCAYAWKPLPDTPMH